MMRLLRVPTSQLLIDFVCVQSRLSALVKTLSGANLGVKPRQSITALRVTRILQPSFLFLFTVL